MRLPPQPFLRAIALRSIIIWIGLRLSATAVTRMVPELPGRDPEPPFALAPSTIAAVVVLSALLTWLDCTRRNEILFLTDLGVSRRMIVLLIGISPLVLSLVTAVLVRL